MTHTATAAMTSAQVRERLVEALRLDLIGPEPHEPEAAEVLPDPPSRWYLTGYLVPNQTPLEDRSDPEGDDQLELLRMPPGTDDDRPVDKPSARRSVLPASIGLTCLVPGEVRTLEAEVRFGDYTATLRDAEIPLDPKQLREAPHGALSWHRQQHVVALPILLPEDRIEHTVQRRADDDAGHGVAIAINCRTLSDRTASELGLPAGTRAVSVFLVNKRKVLGGLPAQLTYLFQAGLTLRCVEGFVPRHDPRGSRAGTVDDEDEAVADLQYRDVQEFAVGHNVATIANVQDGLCTEVSTTWLPQAEIERVEPAARPGEMDMKALAEAADGPALAAMLMPLVAEYRRWIPQQAPDPATLTSERQAVVGKLLAGAGAACDRIEAGIALLADPRSADVRRAFQVANLAMERAARQRRGFTQGKPPEAVEPPRWRPFQLAFVLLNLRAIAGEPGSTPSDPPHPDRDVVDLLFFPTGGGKTEAYLGLAAFTLVLRRLRNPGIASAGVSVLMRYTMRLLTLDQLGRAATLICALELIRRKHPAELGSWPFEIGLWVGQAATPNRMGRKEPRDEHSAREKARAFGRDSDNPSPIPVESCPWCGNRFTSSSNFLLFPNEDAPTELHVACYNCQVDADGEKPFCGKHHLPLVAVDEPLYRRLPCFLIATVDKFASLPWNGHTGGLFGRVASYVEGKGFYRSFEPRQGTPLPDGLPPPDLVIQDELHLISGPLGTVAGLYESAIDALMTRGGRRPKIVASTATVRRAKHQIQALFGRPEVAIFPPPGPDRRDSFFAVTRKAEDEPGRRYIGLAAPGVSAKVLLRRSYTTLLAAAQRLYDEAGGKKNKRNPVDPYMTLLGYFGSLRELGGSRRQVEDEVRSYLLKYGDHRRLSGGEPRFDHRKIGEPVELTSRESTALVARTKERLGRTFFEGDGVDVALATNMIAVGLDVSRLGLMAVFGQPKSAAEYIQATSRVGRERDWPGLVVTLFNVQRPRDRSHFERFGAFHASFYREVEATSVTPFSPRALDRALVAVVVALARHGHEGLTDADGASRASQLRVDLDFVGRTLAERSAAHANLDAGEAAQLRQHAARLVASILDDWATVAKAYTTDQQRLVYHREVASGKSLLHDPLSPERLSLDAAHARFKAHRSMRDVEPSVTLLVKTLGGHDVEETAR